MVMLDTNIILRYLMNDNEKMAELGLKTFAEQNLDFVDCVLYAYNQVKGYKIETFDKKLKCLLEKEE